MTISFESLVWLLVGAWIGAFGIEGLNSEISVISDVAFLSCFVLGTYVLRRMGLISK